MCLIGLEKWEQLSVVGIGIDVRTNGQMTKPVKALPLKVRKLIAIIDMVLCPLFRRETTVNT